VLGVASWLGETGRIRRRWKRQKTGTKEQAKMEILVYVKSIPLRSDYESVVFSSRHKACMPTLFEQQVNTRGGRSLGGESTQLLMVLDRLVDQGVCKIQLIDTGTVIGRLKALRAGVRRAPAVVIDGARHVGLDAARAALVGLR
jgi:hypothetical protein